MSIKPIFVLFIAVIATGSACSSTDVGNGNANSNANAIANIDPRDLPPGLSTSPIPPSANSTPGIPDPKNVNIAPKGTPTPGIPDPKTLGKPFKPGATPTPGIPDPETLRRQMQGISNMKAPPPVAGTNRAPVKKTPQP